MDVPSPSDHPGWGFLAGAGKGPHCPGALPIPEPPPPPRSPAAHLGHPWSLQSRVWGETKGPAQLLAGDERKALRRRLERVRGAPERGCRGPFPARLSRGTPQHIPGVAKPERAPGCPRGSRDASLIWGARGAVGRGGKSSSRTSPGQGSGCRADASDRFSSFRPRKFYSD